MSNRLSMATIHSIETLHRSGHSNREIARLLGVDRGTVNSYVRRLKALAQEEAGRPAEEDQRPGGAEDRPDPRTGTDDSRAKPPTQAVQNRPNPQTGGEAGTMPPGNGDFADLAPLRLPLVPAK